MPNYLDESPALRSRLESPHHRTAAERVGWGIELRTGSCEACKEQGPLTYLGLCGPCFKAAEVGDIVRVRAGVWRPNMADYRTEEVRVPRDLLPASADLVRRFAEAMAMKLRKTEIKYGYTDAWRYPDCIDGLRESLREHMEKGDPLDVANYCAMLWHHGEPTVKPEVPA